MAVRVGRWDCLVCEHIGNLGPIKQCESCGSARPKDVKFYLSDDAEIVKNRQKLKEARAGADWVCSYCNSHNKVSETNCHTCGNDRQIDDGDKSLKQSIKYTDGRKQKLEKSKKVSKPKRIKIPKKASLKTKIGCIVPVALLIIFVILVQFKTDIEVTATSFEWERSISIEKYGKVIENDWQIPTGGKEIESYEAVHHYDNEPDGTVTRTRTVSEQVGTESVKVGEKNLGNGYFEDVYEEQAVYEDREETYEETNYKKVPVYRTKYKYSIFKWTDAGELVTKEKNHNAFWSKDKILESKECRIKEKKGKYFVFLKEEGGEKHKEEVSYNYWKNITIGDKLQAEESSIFGTFYGLKNKK